VPHRSTLVGSVRVVPLCDGYAALPLADEVPGKPVDWEAERRSFPWAFSGESDWAWHVHAFLLQTVDGLTLIDTGIGQLGRPPYDVVGRIEDELASIGVSRDDIRHVILITLVAPVDRTAGRGFRTPFTTCTPPTGRSSPGPPMSRTSRGGGR